MSGTSSVPNTFATQLGAVPASQLDANWNALTQYINAREVSSGTLAARPTSPSAGTWYFANDQNGGTLYFSAATGWVQAALGLTAATSAPLLTAPVTIADSTSGGLAHPFLNLQKTGSETWRAFYQKPAAFSNNPTLSIGPDGGPGLWLNFVSMGGAFPGQRVFIWDSTTTIAAHPHTGALPAFAVQGDLTVGDIVTFSPAGNAWLVGERTATGLVAATDITHIMCASQLAGIDQDGGANIDLYPTQAGAAVSDGIIELIAYGKGGGALANQLIFSNRGGGNTVTRRLRMSSTTFTPLNDVAMDLGQSTLRYQTVFAKSVRASAGTSSTLGFVPAVIDQDAAAGTGSLADTNENDLKTYTVPANTLATNGDALRVTMLFRAANNATTKRIRIYFGGTLILDSGAALTLANNAAEVVLHILRTGASSQFVFGRATVGAIGGTWATSALGEVNYVGTAVSNASGNIVKATSQQGAGAAANDIIQDALVVEYLRGT